MGAQAAARFEARLKMEDVPRKRNGNFNGENDDQPSFFWGLIFFFGGVVYFLTNSDSVKSRYLLFSGIRYSNQHCTFPHADIFGPTFQQRYVAVQILGMDQTSEAQNGML